MDAVRGGAGGERDASPGLVVRAPTAEDYPHVAAALADWMPRDRVDRLLPRGSLTHFAATSLVAIEPQDGEVAGFLIAFVPAEHPGVGYVHFVWVSPERRGSGVGTRLYGAALHLLRENGCTSVEAVTGRANRAAIAFHERLGFAIHDRAAAQAAGDHLMPDEGSVLMTLAL